MDVSNLLEQVALNGIKSPTSPPKKPGKAQSNRPFVMGDTEWLLLACRLHPMMGNFACLLWMYYYLKGRKPIIISEKKLTEWNITKRTSDRLLLLLKDAGLISLTREMRKAPRVSLVVPKETVELPELKKRYKLALDEDEDDG